MTIAALAIGVDIEEVESYDRLSIAWSRRHRPSLPFELLAALLDPLGLVFQRSGHCHYYQQY